MAHNIQNNGGSELSHWQGTNNFLEDNLDISKCFWSSVNQNEEDVSYVFDDDITPVKACGDLAYHTHNCEDMSKESKKCGEPSSQVHRRRMLQFNSEVLEVPLCTEATSSTFLIAEGREDSVEEAFPTTSQLVSGYEEGTSASVHESLDHSSEAWVASCFSDADMQYSPSNMASDVQIDITEIGKTQSPPNSEVGVIQERPAHTRRKVFKGRKLHIQTPAKKVTSVVYPFAFIKPCSLHGDVTLKDINQRYTPRHQN